jgi:hypothetical protein
VILMSVVKRDDRAHSFSGSGNSNLGCAYQEAEVSEPPPRRVRLYSAGQRRATFGAKQRAIGTLGMAVRSPMATASEQVARQRPLNEVSVKG